jgi:acetyltransferase-like isoleucine patch superfamily enzyme
VRRVATFLVARGADVEFGEDCVIDDGFVLECRGRLRVGAQTVFGHHCTLGVVREVVIGPRCLIAELVSIRDHEHEFAEVGRPVIEQGRRARPVVVGENVWLGAKVTVTSGVTIGKDTIVGANSVVTRDLPAGCVAAGAPAKVVRMR